jgi:hypothetical protein
MDAQHAAALVEELKKLNENITQLCLAVRSNSGSKPAAHDNRYTGDGHTHTLESRTSLAMEQLRRPVADKRMGTDKVESLPLASTTKPGRESEARTWGLEIGEASLVLDAHDHG